jgi:dihydroorotase
MSLFISDIRVVDPGSPHNGMNVNIRIEEGRISAIGTDIEKTTQEQEIQLTNGHISPSWVDIGTQSGEPGYEHRETWASLSRAAHAGGYGHLVVRANTHPALDQAPAIRAVRQIQTKEGIQFHPMALASIHAEGKDLTEWLDLADAGAVAFSDGPHALHSNAFMLKALRYSQRVGKPLFHSPHDDSFILGATVHESRQSVEMGLRAWPAASETLLMDRDINLMEYVSTPVVWHNLSSTAAMERLERARQRLGLKVSAGVGYLYLCYTEKELTGFNTSFKLSPPLRSEEDRLDLWRAIDEGLIHYVSSDHYPLEADRKKIPFPYADFGAEGLESTMACFIAHCPLKDPMELWIKLAATGPRELLNWDPVTLEVGQTADFTLFDPDKEWTFQSDHIESRSKNNPNIGREVKGAVLGRIQGPRWLPMSEK